VQTIRSVSTFRMNTYKSVSKQRTLTTCRMNTYAKPQGGGPCIFGFAVTQFVLLPACSTLFVRAGHLRPLGRNCHG
jgi:hypothetical protein